MNWDETLWEEGKALPWIGEVLLYDNSLVTSNKTLDGFLESQTKFLHNSITKRLLA